MPTDPFAQYVGSKDDDPFAEFAQKSAPSTFADEPTSYAGGVVKSLADTGLRTVKGIVKGGASTLNPVNLVRGPYELGKDILTNSGENTLAGLSAIAHGDPEAGGEAIGGLLVGGAMGKLVPKVPEGLRVTGNALEKGGVAARRISPFGIAESVFRGDPKGLAVAAAPYAAEYAGKGLRAAGEYFGAEKPGAPVVNSMAAGYDRYMPNTSPAHRVSATAPEPLAWSDPTEAAHEAAHSNRPLTDVIAERKTYEQAAGQRSIQRSLLTPQEQALLDELAKGEPARVIPKAKVIRQRMLSPGEERSINVLDNVARAKGYGPDYRLPGNGLYKDPTDSLIEQLTKTDSFAKLPKR